MVFSWAVPCPENSPDCPSRILSLVIPAESQYPVGKTSSSAEGEPRGADGGFNCVGVVVGVSPTCGFKELSETPWPCASLDKDAFAAARGSSCAFGARH